MGQIEFYRGTELQLVRDDTPLPVSDVGSVCHSLLIATTTCDATAKDLLGSTAAETATIGSAGQYHTLIWTGVKTGATDVSYTVLARTTDLDGNPLREGWLQLATGTITGAANSWFRIVLTATEGLYFDQYRIVVSQASGSQSLLNKVVGVRR